MKKNCASSWLFMKISAFCWFLRMQNIRKWSVLVTETAFEVFRSREIFCHSDSKQLAVQHRQQTVGSSAQTANTKTNKTH